MWKSWVEPPSQVISMWITCQTNKQLWTSMCTRSFAQNYMEQHVKRTNDHDIYLLGILFQFLVLCMLQVIHHIGWIWWSCGVERLYELQLIAAIYIVLWRSPTRYRLITGWHPRILSFIISFHRSSSRVNMLASRLYRKPVFLGRLCHVCNWTSIGHTDSWTVRTRTPNPSSR